MEISYSLQSTNPNSKISNFIIPNPKKLRLNLINIR